MTDNDNRFTVSWTRTPNGPSAVRCLRVGTMNVRAGRLTVAPHHAGFLVHRMHDSGEIVATFVNPHEWHSEWSIRSPSFSARDVGCWFIGASRYLLAAREVSMWERTEKIWGTTLPEPRELDMTIERDRRPAGHDPPRWKLVSSRAPTTDDQHAYVRVHWVLDLGSRGYYYENELVDRATVEVLSLQDGRWLHRVQVPYGSEPSIQDAPLARDECRIIGERQVELIRDGARLGVAEIGEGGIIHDAAMLDDRLVIATEGDRFAYIELVA